MKKFFTTDIPTKLLALAIAFVLWIYLMIFLNPDIEINFSNIPITYSEHSTLTKNGYVITNDSLDSVSIKVKGPRNMLANAKKNNISAFIDLSGCSEVGTHSLPINVRLPYDELSVVNKSQYNVSITVDKVINRNYDLEVISEGTPKNKFHLDGLKSNIKTVNIEGPSELIKSIESVVAYVDINGIDRDRALTSKVEILNNRGETIKSELLTLSVEEIEVNCTVLAEKNVKVDLANIKVPSGYEVASVTPAEITIIGRQEVLDTITSAITYEKWLETKTGAITTVEINVPRDVEAKETSVEIVLKEKDKE